MQSFLDSLCFRKSLRKPYIGFPHKTPGTTFPDQAWVQISIIIASSSSSPTTLSVASSDESFQQSSEENHEKRTATILNTFRSPTALDLSRERTIQCNLRKDGKQYRPPKESSNQKNINPSFRVKQFPGENLIVSNGKLFCNACREENGLKKRSLKTILSQQNMHLKALHQKERSKGKRHGRKPACV